MTIKKAKFKQIIRGKIKKKALEYLLVFKNGHSKGKEAKFTKLEMQKYIRCKNFTKAQKSLLYNLRFRMTKAKMNFKNMFIDTICDLCKKDDESTRHYLECEVLINKCPELYNDRAVRYEDLFGNIKAQRRAVILFEKVLKKREELLKNYFYDTSIILVQCTFV